MELNGQEYQAVNPSALTATNILLKAWEQLGRPQTPFSRSGKKVMDLIIAIWEDLYPVDRETWRKDIKNYKAAELSIAEQVKGQTGRSLASYPFPIFKMMAVVFREFDPAERNNCMKMVKKWPIFQVTNKV